MPLQQTEAGRPRNLSRPDAGHAGYGYCLAVCRSSAGAFWWTKGGNERDLADRRKLSVNGLYAHTFRLVWRLVADRHRDAPVAV